MYDKNIDYMVTPRPQYLADGGKLPDIYTVPSDLRETLQRELGTFPLHKFWGPLTGIESSKWIADATLLVDRWYNPTFSLVYLPHLDYCLQKFGPEDKSVVPQHLREIDEQIARLISHYEATYPDVKIMVLSEYGISPVNKVIHVNKILREAGYLKVRKENYGETLDCGASPAFALSDHQIAHIYIQDIDRDLQNIKALFEKEDGVEYVLDAQGQDEYYNNKDKSRTGAYNVERSGDLVLVAKSNVWFSYYYWMNPKQAPDFARCVAIHRKVSCYCPHPVTQTLS
jgi:predicted AlkP superfamily pyrophosphatase or phosphodiesterase